MAKKKIRMSMDDFTLGDLEVFENVTGGLDLMEVMTPVVVRDPETNKPMKDPDDPKGRPLTEVRVPGRAFIGLMFIAMHHDNPEITLDEVKKLRFGDFEFDLTDGVANDEANPPEAADAPPEVIPPPSDARSG